MHIAHVITSLYPGGAQSALSRLCMNDAGNQHTVITMIGGGDLEVTLRCHGIEVVSLGFTPKGGFLSGMTTLWKKLKECRPDLVQTWMYHPDLLAGLCARLAGVQHVCWGIRHTALEAGYSSRSSILAARLCARLSGLVPSRIVCCAQEAARLHASLGYRADKLVVIPNGYDLSAFYPYTDREACKQALLPGEDTTLPLIGMVGRFNPEKDHANLLEALAEVKARGRDFRCLLVGANLDANNARLDTWIAKHELTHQVHLLGVRSDIPRIMNALDLHVLSSFSEAFPNVIAEAMACGTPCVATNVGDSAMIIGDTGWVVPPRNPLQLADAIQSALEMRESKSSRWSEKCDDCVSHITRNFTINKMVASFDSVWKDCIKKRE